MTLSVTPWVSGNDEVTMDIRPSFDVPGTSPSPEIPPTVNRRTLSSKVRVRNGEMIVLGGLIGESRTESMDKVPFLGDIPILSYIFSNRRTEKSKTQLMIYLIPHIYYGSERSIDPETVRVGSFAPPALLSERQPSKAEERKLRRDLRHARWQAWREARKERHTVATLPAPEAPGDLVGPPAPVPAAPAGSTEAIPADSTGTSP